MLDVVIVSNPDKNYLKQTNLEYKSNNKKCKHLVGTECGKMLCAIHDKKWFKKTPCAMHTQYETKNSECRIGTHILNEKKQKLKNFLENLCKN
jgi:hypothetical protein